jgi:hypothetical protein
MWFLIAWMFARIRPSFWPLPIFKEVHHRTLSTRSTVCFWFFFSLWNLISFSEGNSLVQSSTLLGSRQGVNVLIYAPDMCPSVGLSWSRSPLLLRAHRLCLGDCSGVPGGRCLFGTCVGSNACDCISGWTVSVFLFPPFFYYYYYF